MPLQSKLIRRLDDEFSLEDVGSTLLQDLAKGIYQPEEVIREYIQNAVDAHRLWVGETGSEPDGPIQVEIRGNAISIYDYGIGMDEPEIRKVKSIAVSGKPIEDDLGLTGYKGVGIWAGLSYFETMVLYSTMQGSDRGYQLTVQFKNIVGAIDRAAHIGEVLNPNYTIEEFEEQPDEHYTVVTLENPVQPRSGDKFTNPDKVRAAIRHICPCEIDPTFVFRDEVAEWYGQRGFALFPIQVDSIPTYRSYPSSVEEFESGSITVNDAEVAHYWRAINKSNRVLSPQSGQLAGFRVIQDGFVLDGQNLYADRDLPGYDQLKIFQYPNWYVGEIHVTLPDLRPNLPRREFEQAEITRQFIHALRNWYRDAMERARVLSEIRNLLKSYESYQSKLDDLCEKEALLAPEDEDYSTLKEILAEVSVQEEKVESYRGRRKPHYSVAALRNTRSQRRRIMSQIGELLPDESADRIEDTCPEVGEADESGSVAAELIEVAAPHEPDESLVDQASKSVDDRLSIGVEVVLSLLEEVLGDELSDNAERVQEIVDKLRKRILLVMSDGQP